MEWRSARWGSRIMNPAPGPLHRMRFRKCWPLSSKPPQSRKTYGALSRIRWGPIPFTWKKSIIPIHSGILRFHKGTWQLSGSLDQPDIPSTIHAVIAGRIDRLDEAAKHLLQEASVIGRTVPYEALKNITRHADTLDQLLKRLEALDLLRRTSQSEQKYVFKTL